MKIVKKFGEEIFKGITEEIPKLIIEKVTIFLQNSQKKKIEAVHLRKFSRFFDALSPLVWLFVW